MPGNGTNSTGPAVKVEGLVFSYGSIKVLDEISLEIPVGEVFGILGANGAGKTTLIRLLVGLMKPASGGVQVLGEPPSSRRSDRVGYMPQLNALYLELSVLENLSFFARMYGMSDKASRRESVESVLRLVGLWDRRDDPVLRLSGGMRQRVSLAISLVHSPPLLLLDEPTVGLDPELRASFWDHFRDMAEAGTTLIISSHTMDDAAHCDRLAFLREGRFVGDGSPDELRAATGRDDATLEEAFLHFVRGGQS
ncbi:MAG: ABC transporter ATP-binding protein [Chloroflexi bacterium]|nr:ABC transporter ATP-binding protein [Chloroflexota bacterium]